MDAIGTPPQLGILLLFIHYAGEIAFITITIVSMIVITKLCNKYKVKNNNKWAIIIFVLCCVSILYMKQTHKEKVEKQIVQKQREEKQEEQEISYAKARAVFDEQCKKAGEKIYRTVDNVDGIMLLKVREENKENIFALLADPMWDEAAITNVESSNGSYIGSFLRKYRIRFGKRNGYSFVDVLKADGSISRYFDYKGHDDIDEERDGVIKNPSDPARYAVTYEYNVDPELRKHWVAGITIKIIDRQTDELLAEKTIFSFEPGLGSTATARTPWYNAVHCPELLQRDEDHNPTSRFVVTVLKP